MICQPTLCCLTSAAIGPAAEFTIIKDLQPTDFTFIKDFQPAMYPFTAVLSEVSATVEADNESVFELPILLTALSYHSLLILVETTEKSSSCLQKEPHLLLCEKVTFSRK